MNRRDTTLALLALSLAPEIAWAQPQAAQVRIGVLSAGASPKETDHPNWPVFFAEMRRFGYEEGRNVVYEVRNAGGASEKLSRLAGELVAAKPQLIVVTGTSEAVAAAGATTTIPIVMMHGSYDPVEMGLARSLARPGRNVTGMISTIPGFSAKALEFLLEVLPNAKRIGVLANPGASHFIAFRKELEGVAAAKRITLLPTSEARGPREMDTALAAIATAKPQAIIVHHDALFFIQRQRIIDFCARARLPAMYRFTEDVEAGGLMSYAAQYRELYARAATFVDKILKGSKPGDIPIEQPTRFGLWINLKTAKALDLKIPQAVLLRADRVIE